MNLLRGIAQPSAKASTSAICAQPTRVIASPFFGLEFFGMDQCVEEVEAEPNGDDQPQDWFTHCLPLELTQGQRVKAHQRQYRATQRYERDIQHDHLLAGRASIARSRKRSIWICCARCKDFIKPQRLVGIGSITAGNRDLKLCP